MGVCGVCGVLAPPAGRVVRTGRVAQHQPRLVAAGAPAAERAAPVGGAAWRAHNYLAPSVARGCGGSVDQRCFAPRAMHLEANRCAVSCARDRGIALGIALGIENVLSAMRLCGELC